MMPHRFLPTGFLPLLAFTGGLFGGSPSPLEAQQPYWIGFRGDLGAEVPNGSAGSLFQGNIRGEFSLLFQPGPFPPFYLGVGAGWVTYHLESAFQRMCDTPLQEEDPLEISCEPWNYIGFHLILGAYLDRWLPLPAYVEGRVVGRRLRPMERRFWAINSDDYIKDRPYPEYDGFGVEAAAGLRKSLTTSGKTYFDLSARIGQFIPGDVEFDDLFAHLPRVKGGWILGLQIGLVWFP